MKRWIWRYKYTIAIVVGFCIITSLGLCYYAWSEQTKQHAKEEQRTAQMKLLDKKIADLKTKMAQKAAEEKTRSEAHAKVNEALKTGQPPASTATIPTGKHSDPSRYDVIVNKKHPITPLGYAPPLANTSCAGISVATIQPAAVADLDALCQAATAANVPLAISSSYRSYQNQISTYNHWVAQSGQADADTYSARPGYSEHQTGWALDFKTPQGAALSSFTDTPQQLWLATHASEFGFIQRYCAHNTAETGYTAESWHYRYIGREASIEYTKSNASSLEAFWGVTGGGY